MSKKLISIGEALMDYVPDDKGGFLKLVGGAPLNLTAMVSVFNIPNLMYVCLGKDENSQIVKKTMKENHISLDRVKEDKDLILAHTEVQVDKATGQREFTFFNDRASFLGLKAEDLVESDFKRGDHFHFGSVWCLDDEAVNTQLKACEIACEQGCTISFDPNLRPSLFKKGVQEKLCELFLPYVDILKISDSELLPITKEADMEKAVKKLFSEYLKLKMILITCGSDGMKLFVKEKGCLSVPACPVDKMIDTVGCGDCSFGAFLASLLANGCDLTHADTSDLLKAMNLASLVGSLLCSRKGALPLPSLEEIKSKALKLSLNIGL